MPAGGREDGGGVVVKDLLVMRGTWRRSARERHFRKEEMDELSKANGSKSNCALFSGIAGDAMQRVVPRSNWCSSEDYLIHQPPPKDGFTSCQVLESGVRGNPPAPFGRGECAFSRQKVLPRRALFE